MNWTNKWYKRAVRRGAISFVLITIAGAITAVKTGEWEWGYEIIVLPLLMTADKIIRDHEDIE